MSGTVTDPILGYVVEGAPYEEAMLPPTDDDGFGYTRYDAGIPGIGLPLTKGTDTNVELGLPRGAYVEWTDLDYEVGGEPGAVNRNAWVDNGIPNLWDMHDFRGDHPAIPRTNYSGAFGDVGSSDDYANQYAQGIAANGYPDISMEESWDEVSAGY